MGKVIVVEGYKAFRGIMAVEVRVWHKPLIGGRKALIAGEWLYRPDTDCWYGCGKSYPASICTIWEVQ